MSGSVLMPHERERSVAVGEAGARRDHGVDDRLGVRVSFFTREIHVDVEERAAALLRELQHAHDAAPVAPWLRGGLVDLVAFVDAGRVVVVAGFVARKAHDLVEERDRVGARHRVTLFALRGAHDEGLLLRKVLPEHVDVLSVGERDKLRGFPVVGVPVEGVQEVLLVRVERRPHLCDARRREDLDGRTVRVGAGDGRVSAAAACAVPSGARTAAAARASARRVASVARAASVAVLCPRASVAGRRSGSAPSVGVAWIQ
jgi:hypothetical protein